jgi:hypothetical protein
VDQVTAATLKFTTQVTDPKAAIITSYFYLSGQVEVFPSNPNSTWLVYIIFLHTAQHFGDTLLRRSYTSIRNIRRLPRRTFLNEGHIDTILLIFSPVCTWKCHHQQSVCFTISGECHLLVTGLQGLFPHRSSAALFRDFIANH